MHEIKCILCDELATWTGETWVHVDKDTQYWHEPVVDWEPEPDDSEWNEMEEQ